MYSKIKKMYSNVYQVCMSLMSIIYKSVSFCLHGIFIFIYYIDQNIFTHKKRNQESLSFFTLTSPARMVAISPCMKAHGTLEPTRGHFSPLGQYTSPVAPCCLMLSREQGKQNLWDATEGHCTKCVSSSLSWQSVATQRDAAGNRGVWDALRMHRIHARNMRHHSALCQPPLVGRKRGCCYFCGWSSAPGCRPWASCFRQRCPRPEWAPRLENFHSGQRPRAGCCEGEGILWRAGRRSWAVAPEAFSIRLPPGATAVRLR